VVVGAGAEAPTLPFDEDEVDRRAGALDRLVVLVLDAVRGAVAAGAGVA